MITAASFPTPHLALRSNDSAGQDRVTAFADLQAAAAEDLRRHFTDAGTAGLPFHKRLDMLRTAHAGLLQWRYQLALATPGRLGAGLEPDAAHFLMDHRVGGESYDRLGYTGRMRAGATWNPDTRTFVGGESTPASATLVHYGRAARDRFDVEAPNDDMLQNQVTLPSGGVFCGNRLARGEAAARIAKKLKARVARRGRDTSMFEVGGDPVYAVTAYPEDADLFHSVGLRQLAAAFDHSSAEQLATWQEARYLLYQGRQTKKGSDAVTRVFLVAVGAVLFGQPPVMEQDADLRCMVLGQAAATEMPADAPLRSAVAGVHARGGA